MSDSVRELNEFLDGRKFGTIGFEIDEEVETLKFQWRYQGYDEWDDATDEDALMFLKLLSNVLAEKGLVETGTLGMPDDTVRQAVLFKD